MTDIVHPGSPIRLVEVSPIVTASSAYTAADLVGGKLTLANAAAGSGSAAASGGGGLIRGAVLKDDAKQSVDTDVVLFDADPSNTMFTDHGVFNPADADLARILGVIQLTRHVEFSNNGLSLPAAAFEPIPFVVAIGAQALYAALVTRGTPTYAAADDLTLRLLIENR